MTTTTVTFNNPTATSGSGGVNFINSRVGTAKLTDTSMTVNTANAGANGGVTHLQAVNSNMNSH